MFSFFPLLFPFGFSVYKSRKHVIEKQREEGEGKVERKVNDGAFLFFFFSQWQQKRVGFFILIYLAALFFFLDPFVFPWFFMDCFSKTLYLFKSLREKLKLFTSTNPYPNIVDSQKNAFCFFFFFLLFFFFYFLINKLL